MKKFLLYSLFVAACFLTAACREAVDPVITAKSISLKPQTVIMDKGETRQLDVYYEPENAAPVDLVWGSNKPAVASVDDKGIVTAKMMGEAYITVKSVDGTLKATCTVKVNVPKYTVTLYYKGTETPVPEKVYGYPGMELELDVKSSDGQTHTYTWDSTSEDVTVDQDGKAVLGYGTTSKSNCQFFGNSVVNVSNEDGYNVGVDVYSTVMFLLDGEYFELGSQAALTATAEYSIEALYLTEEGAASLPLELVKLTSSNNQAVTISEKDGHFVIVSSKCDDVVDVYAEFAGKKFTLFQISKNISTDGSLEDYNEITY